MLQTPAPNAGWTRNEATPPKAQEDGWGAPPPTPATKVADDWGTPSSAPPQSPAPARAAPGIHPSRLAMLGGQGAAKEYVSPSRPQTQGPPPRELPPHMASQSNGNGNGYGGTPGRVAETPRPVSYKLGFS